jgi:hypothetical protein
VAGANEKKEALREVEWVNPPNSFEEVEEKARRNALYDGLETCHDDSMSTTRHFRDLYRFPGFEPVATLRGVFGDPMAVVATLRRRRKKRLAGDAAKACRCANENPFYVVRCLLESLSTRAEGVKVGGKWRFCYGAAPPNVPPRWDHARRAAAGVKLDGTPAVATAPMADKFRGFARS